MPYSSPEKKLFFSAAENMHDGGKITAPALRFVDLHCDLPSFLLSAKRNGDTFMPERLASVLKEKVSAVICALYCDDRTVAEGRARQETLLMLGEFFAFAEKFPFLSFVTDKKQLSKALCENKTALLLSIEGAECVENDLDMYCRSGVRFLGVTHSRKNKYACGTLDPPEPEFSRSGFTAEGKKLLSEASDLGMAVDMSHLNDAGCAYLLDVYDKPLFISHGSARSLVPLQRASSDDVLLRLAERGSVMGVTGVNFLINASHFSEKPLPPDILPSPTSSRRQNLITQLRDKPDTDIGRFELLIKYLAFIGGNSFPALGIDLFYPPSPHSHALKKKRLQSKEFGIEDVFPCYEGLKPFNDMYDLSVNSLRFIFSALPD